MDWGNQHLSNEKKKRKAKQKNREEEEIWIKAQKAKKEKAGGKQESRTGQGENAVFEMTK